MGGDGDGNRWSPPTPPPPLLPQAQSSGTVSVLPSRCVGRVSRRAPDKLPLFQARASATGASAAHEAAAAETFRLPALTVI